jgi:Domain of unknown function (DUF4387)
MTPSVGQLARVCRSKNAGAAFLTFDVILPDQTSYVTVKRTLTPQRVAEECRVDASAVSVVCWPEAYAVKITIPRQTLSGSPGDRDVYGCQQHRWLWTLKVKD